MDELDEKGTLTLALAGGEVVLNREDLLIEMVQQAGYVSQNEGDLAVVLDTNLTEDLIEEGFVNELVSKLQNMRKDSGFEVTDRIVIGLAGNEKVADILRRHEAEITAQVLANAVTYGEVAEGAREWNLNGEKVTLSVTRV
jgi:isoleucyl-tRNA synthetase